MPRDTPTPARPSTAAGDAVAYVLKGYPRISELFVASEIYRVEQTGVDLRLFVIKAADESVTHPVVQRIRAVPQYLPEATSLSRTSLTGWLRRNLPAFAPAIGRVARRRPLGLARALAAAAAQSLRDRPSALAPPRKLYVKEVLQGIALADGILAAPEIRHIHAHFAHGATTVTWFASLVTGLPFSFTGHAKDIYEESLNPAGLLRRKLRAAAFTVTCTEANVHHLKAVEPRAAIHRVYHGLNADLAAMLAGDPPARTPGERFRVLAVGRLVEKKGFDVLIRACAQLVRAGHDLEARIVGPDDEHGPVLRRLIEDEGLTGRVELVGTMTQEALLGEYLAADAFCVPCRVMPNGDRDGIPNVLVEAMACGLPVVSTPVSGIPELIEHGVDGLLVPSEDAAALADALARLEADRAAADALGAHGRETVRTRFDGDRLARSLAGLFERRAA